MNTGLSKREKILLFVTGLVLLSFLTGYFVIAPLYDKWHDNGEEALRLEHLQENMELTLNAEVQSFGTIPPHICCSRHYVRC